MTPRIKGVLAGGIVGGLLSAIPFVNWGNCLCCLWIILAGAIASTVHVKSSTEGVSKTDGTITGLISAVPMVALYVIVGLPLNLLLGPANSFGKKDRETAYLSRLISLSAVPR